MYWWLFYFFFMVYNFSPYDKQPKTILQLLEKLQQQGLVISDFSEAVNFLNQVNYYRFRGYLYPYLRRDGKCPTKFLSQITFEKAREVYEFDRCLRHTLFGVLSKVEVLIRTRLDVVMSIAAGHSFWYLEKRWFKPEKQPRGVIDRLHSAFVRSKEEFAEHYHQHYYNKISPSHKGLPPFWVASELLSFGQICELMRSLDAHANSFKPLSKASPNSPLDKMAQSLGAPSFKCLISWMESLHAVRNLCAHHGRLWNRNLRAPLGLKGTFLKVQPISNSNREAYNTCYASIIVMRQICKVAKIDDGLFHSLVQLLDNYPEVKSTKSSMGIPDNWQDCIIWKS